MASLLGWELFGSKATLSARSDTMVGDLGFLLLSIAGEKEIQSAWSRRMGDGDEAYPDTPELGIGVVVDGYLLGCADCSGKAAALWTSSFFTLNHGALDQRILGCFGVSGT